MLWLDRHLVAWSSKRQQLRVSSVRFGDLRAPCCCLTVMATSNASGSDALKSDAQSSSEYLLFRVLV